MTIPALLPMEKPLLILEELISLLLPYAKPIQEKNADSLHLYNNDQLLVALVIEGEVNIYHRSNMMLLTNAKAPFIFGLQGSLYQYTLFKLQPLKNAKISVLPRKKALEIIIKHHAFPQTLVYQTYLSEYQASRNNLLINRTSLHSVCGLIEELARLKPEERIKISISKYVLDRSNLARSGVMKTLATLREEGFIKVENGKLIKLIKKLPIQVNASEHEILEKKVSL